MSEKGQVVIPKDVRDALKIAPGQQFDVLRAGGDIILRPTGQRHGMCFDDALSAMRQRVRYDGPVIPIEDLNWSPNIHEDDHAQ